MTTSTQPTGECSVKRREQYTKDKLKVGCYVDASASSADYLNQRIIDLAADYGFTDNLLCGYFDGPCGHGINMTLDDAESAAHQGECNDDVAELAKQPEIAAQLDKFTTEQLRESLKATGGWSDDELADDAQNRLRALWIAAGNAKEDASEQLNEIADSAVEYLNELETRPYMAWTVDDNSLFLSADVDGAREDVGFVSHADNNWTEDCYCERQLVGFGKWAIVNKDASRPAKGYRGEWLHVSDHGNCTLYIRGDDGKDVEIWSVV